MKQQRSSIAAQLSLLAVAFGVGACDGGAEDSSTSASTQNLTAECLEAGEAPPEGAWICPAPLTLECRAEAPALYVRGAADGCGMSALSARIPATLLPGTHPVRVTGESGSVACETTLTVVDTVAPRVEPQTLNIWPPNHKLHTISVADCVRVTDACDPALTGEFTWASSDEPVNDKGDGNHEPDILVDDCGHVRVRAERQGPKDGRVYKLGVRVVDRGGHVVESQCTVVVDHDKRGVVGADSGEAYRITLDGTGGNLLCDGEPPPSEDTPSDETPPAQVETDAGTPSTGDAGTPGTGDAGTPSTDDASTPDAGTPPLLVM